MFCVFIRTNKRPLNLYIDADLIKKSKNHGLIISKFLENQLKSYFEFIEQRQQQFTPYNPSNQCDTDTHNK